MPPLIQALLGRWEWRFEVLAVLVPLGILYTLGWYRLRRQGSKQRLATWPRLVSYLSGLFCLAIALISPVDRLGGQLFFMHMIQHKLVIVFAAPLMLLANPFPFMLWALPTRLRRQAARPFRRGALVRQGLSKVGHPVVTWLIFITIYIGWHDPMAYNMALSHEWVHDMQHISFAVGSLLYWWPIIGAAPRVHGKFPAWGKIAYLLVTIPPNMLIGVSIAYASSVTYTYYLSVPRIWGLTVMQDQQLGGVIMWIPGSQMFLMVALFILARMFGREKRLDTTKREWDNESSMIAPGLEDRVVQNRWRRLQAAGTQETTPVEPRVDVTQHV